MRAKSEKRKADIRMSNEVHKLLEDNFYFTEASNYEDITDKERQIKGVDVIFDYNGFHYLCDEKAAVRWRNLKTYTLELAFVGRNGDIVEGWLTNDKLDTNSYMLIWVEDNCIEYALIRKDRIMEMMASMGWTKECLRIKAERIRNNPNEPMGNLIENGCCFKYSRNYVECPINIQFPKESYLSIADKHGIISTEQFKGRKNEI